MLSQIQTQKQQLKILPQQIQMLNIFHLNVLELDQRISDELDENPLLEMNEEEELKNLQKKTLRITKIGKNTDTMMSRTISWNMRTISIVKLFQTSLLNHLAITGKGWRTR